MWHADVHRILDSHAPGGASDGPQGPPDSRDGTWLRRACAAARRRLFAGEGVNPADIAGPAYAIDDQTAIKLTDGTVAVVSEGHWKLFSPSAVARASG